MREDNIKAVKCNFDSSLDTCAMEKKVNYFYYFLSFSLFPLVLYTLMSLEIGCWLFVYAWQSIETKKKT